MIKLEGVSKIFKGDVVALKNATAEIQRGEFVFLVGPSGSGKSTFIRLLNREEVADSGRIMVAGKDIGALRSWKVPYLRREIGYIFQDYKLLNKKTVAENVAFGLEVIGRQRNVIRKQVPAILELVGLSTKAERFPDELSGGEQQRVSIARRPHQPLGHHGRDGDPRPRHRRHHAPPGHRTRPGRRRARRVPRGVRVSRPDRVR